jgi:N-acetylmuramoyl-L-alanine amidase
VKVHRPRVDRTLYYGAPLGHHPKNLIVLHQTISPDLPGIKDIASVGAYLAHVGYAIHMIVDKDANSGAVTPEFETAVYEHATSGKLGVNHRSIGIEQVSYKTGIKGYWWGRPRELNKVARWCAYLCKKHGIPPVYDPTCQHGICGHWDVTRAGHVTGGHTDVQYPDYPTKWVAKAAATYMKTGWA